MYVTGMDYKSKESQPDMVQTHFLPDIHISEGFGIDQERGAWRLKWITKLAFSPPTCNTPLRLPKEAMTTLLQPIAETGTSLTTGELIVFWMSSKCQAFFMSFLYQLHRPFPTVVISSVSGTMSVCASPRCIHTLEDDEPSTTIDRLVLKADLGNLVFKEAQTG